MRHCATHLLWALPAFGEVVAITSPGPKQSLDKRGQMGMFLYCQSSDIHFDCGHQGHTTSEA
eukprot:2303478-Prorocentrum_lima.AAC.1